MALISSPVGCRPIEPLPHSARFLCGGPGRVSLPASPPWSARPLRWRAVRSRLRIRSGVSCGHLGQRFGNLLSVLGGNDQVILDQLSRLSVRVIIGGLHLSGGASHVGGGLGEVGGGFQAVSSVGSISKRVGCLIPINISCCALLGGCAAILFRLSLFAARLRSRAFWRSVNPHRRSLTYSRIVGAGMTSRGS